MFRIARPCRVGLVRAERGAYGVQSLHKIPVGPEHFQNFRSDAGHDVHIDDDVRRVADLHTDLGNRRAEGAHAVGDDIHRPSPH